VHLTAPQLEAHAVERAHAGEGFADVPQRQQRRR
jgi:hypothetical protein